MTGKETSIQVHHSSTESSERKCANWIEGFVEFTAGLKTPPIFRRWAAICAVAGAMERKVWLETDQGKIYPNLYVLLVARPGIGKGEALKTLRNLWLSLDDFFVASDTVSEASMLDELKEASRKIFRPMDASPLTEFHSVQVVSTEFSTFLSVYDTKFMSYLQQWYDCEPIFSESRRGRKKGEEAKKAIKNPQVSLIAGTTPNFLGKMLPEGAWDQGFCARTIPIFSSHNVPIRLWGGRKDREALYHNLAEDLKSIHSAFGKLGWDNEAAGAMQNWLSDGCSPEPTHPKLANYNTRRPVHMLKLCAVMCMSRAGNDMTINREDFEGALMALVEAEKAMPGIFAEMVSSESATTMQEVLHFIKEQTKNGQPVPMSKIIHYIARFTPTREHGVLRVYENMLKAGLIRVHSVGERGNDMILPT